MATQRTESLRINVSRETARRMKIACAKLRVSPDDLFEIGFNAVFPPAPPRHMPQIKKPLGR